ncbi:MAG TPA: DinB family protein [Thermoanaerobaculia bacterium]
MRSTEEVAKLLGYNRWANGRTLESVAPLTQDEIDRKLGGSFSSVRETLVHIYGAEWIWLERWRGTSPKGLPSPDELKTLAGLQERWANVEEERSMFARGLSDERLVESISYFNLAGEGRKNRLGELFVHVVNHSSYHRGQVATMLRQLGRKPLSTDYVLYLDTGGK